SGEGLTVVGDDAQAIYSFRAATVDNILNFETQFSARKVELEENYRSTQPILDSANELIGKNLFSRKKEGAKPYFVSVADDEGQLERLYDASQVRAGDLLQLERLSASCESREAFLTEMALDPPSATSDLSGAPYLDEDYLILSTVHSAKGQEWDAVHVLNVTD